ncbi:major capsid protein [Pseudomonas moraviensis]
MNLQDLFTVANLTAAVNKLPAIPGKVGAMGLFDEKGVTSTSVIIDEREGRLVLVPNTSRNDDPAPVKGNKRKRRTFETLHLPISRPLLPSQLLGIAAFGQESATAPMATVINDHLQDLKNSIETTREFQRVGALRGKLLDADGSVLFDPFDEFAVEQKSVTVALSSAGTNVRKCEEVDLGTIKTVMSDFQGLGMVGLIEPMASTSWKARSPRTASTSKQRESSSPRSKACRCSAARMCRC